MTATTNLESLSHMAVTLRVPVSRIASVVDELRLAPALRLNDAAYFDSTQAQRIAERLKESK